MRLLVGSLLLAVSSTAAADPDRCASGLQHEAAGQLPRAFLDLEACIAAKTDSADHRAAHRRARRALDRGEFALITLATTPEGAAVAIEPLAREVATGRVYLAPGTYTLAATHPGHQPLSRVVEVTGRYRETLELVLPAKRNATAATTTVDMTGEAPNRTAIARGKDPEHENLLPERYQQGQPTGVAAEAARRSRWPSVLVGIGIAAVAAGVVLHLDDRAGPAAGLYASGGIGLGLGVTGLVLRW